MFKAPHSGSRGALLGIALLGMALPLALGTSTIQTVAGFTTDGADAKAKPLRKPGIEAAFPRQSYRPGAVARLVIFSRVSRNVSVQVFVRARKTSMMKPRDEMYGTAVTDVRRLGTVRRNPQVIWLPIPDSPSGLYFAKLTGSGRRVGYAPFILRPRQLGENRVALVLPTLSWQAYNCRDDDRTAKRTPGTPAHLSRGSSSAGRSNTGRSPSYKYYDQPFLAG